MVLLICEIHCTDLQNLKSEKRKQTSSKYTVDDLRGLPTVIPFVSCMYTLDIMVPFQHDTLPYVNKFVCTTESDFPLIPLIGTLLHEHIPFLLSSRRLKAIMYCFRLSFNRFLFVCSKLWTISLASTSCWF